VITDKKSMLISDLTPRHILALIIEANFAASRYIFSGEEAHTW